MRKLIIVILSVLATSVSARCNIINQDSSSFLSTVQGPRREFLRKLIPIAEEMAVKYQIPASAIISMAIHESGYGQSALARNSKNYFGIKAYSDWRGPKTLHQGSDGRFYYRKYASMRAGVEDYCRFLQKPRYSRAFKYRCGVRFVSAVLRSGYCPDPRYISNIMKITKRHRLALLDPV